MSLRVSLLILLLATSVCAEELTLERAVESTLKLQADIIYSKLSADASKRLYEGTSGAFDHILSSSAQLSSAQTPLNSAEKRVYNRDLLKNESQNYSAKLSKLTRSGIGFETSASVATTNDMSFNKPRESTSSIGVSINFPIYDLLLENRNTTNEKIALENSRASLNDYFFQASSSIYMTVVNYWSYLAAYEKLLIYRKSEQNTQKMLLDFEKLIETGERPRADANQIKANLAAKHGRVVSGEKELATRGYELAKSMGIPYDDSSLAPPKVQWVNAKDSGEIVVDEFIQNAYEKRFDIKSLENVMRSAELMLESSKRGLKPDLNLYVAADNADKAHSISGDVVDNARSVSAGILFTKPLENSYAKGDVAEKEIALRQWKLNLANAKRKASLDVASSLNELKQSLKAYKMSLETVNLYHEALRVEGSKFKLGMSTVIDVINTHENYQSAMIGNIDDLRLVAVSLAGVVFDTGSMIMVNDEMISVNIPSLYSLVSPKKIN